MIATELVGKRVLITSQNTFRGIEVSEVKILEVSPSGNWVKLLNAVGNKYWVSIMKFSVVEVLTDLKAGKPSTDKETTI